MLLALLLLAAPDAGVACVPASADARVKVKLKAGTPVRDALKWANTILCGDLKATGDEQKVAVAVEGELRAGDVEALVTLLAKTAGAQLIAPGPKACPDGIAAGIKKVDDLKYEVKRSAFDELLGAPTCFGASARIVPSFKDGKAQGFKVFSIRANSLWAALGLLNGDTLMAVNDMPLDSPDRALEAYAKVRDATELRFALERRGAPLTVTWIISH